MSMSTRRVAIVLVVGMMWFSAAASLLALTLEEAKTRGLVGEKSNGYLGVVAAGGSDVQTLVSDVNQKRRQAYEDIAKRNGAQITAVETLAGEKAIQNTKSGNFIEGPGGWTKK